MTENRYWAAFDDTGKCILITTGGVVDALYVKEVPAGTSPDRIAYDQASGEVIEIEPLQLPDPPPDDPMVRQSELAELRARVEKLERN